MVFVFYYILLVKSSPAEQPLKFICETTDFKSAEQNIKSCAEVWLNKTWEELEKTHQLKHICTFRKLNKTLIKLQNHEN